MIGHANVTGRLDVLKSRFFRALDLESEEGKAFQRGLKVLLRLPPEASHDLIADLPKALFLFTKADVESFRNAQLQRLGLAQVDAELVTNGVLVPCLTAFVDLPGEEHVPVDMVDDLQEL